MGAGRLPALQVADAPSSLPRRDSLAGFSPAFGRLAPSKQQALVADLLALVARLRQPSTAGAAAGPAAGAAAAAAPPAKKASLAAVAAQALARLETLSVSSSAASSEAEGGSDEEGGGGPLSAAQRQAVASLRELAALPGACDTFLAHVLAAHGGGDVQAAAAWMLECDDLAGEQAAWQARRAERAVARAAARAEREAAKRQIVSRFQLQVWGVSTAGLMRGCLHVQCCKSDCRRRCHHCPALRLCHLPASLPRCLSSAGRAQRRPRGRRRQGPPASAQAAGGGRAQGRRRRERAKGALQGRRGGQHPRREGEAGAAHVQRSPALPACWAGLAGASAATATVDRQCSGSVRPAGLLIEPPAHACPALCSMSLRRSEKSGTAAREGRCTRKARGGLRGMRMRMDDGGREVAGTGACAAAERAPALVAAARPRCRFCA